MTNCEARRLAKLTHSLRKCGPCDSCQYSHERAMAGIDAAEARGELYSPSAVSITDYDFSSLPIRRK